MSEPTDHRRGPESERLILRAFEVADAAAFYRLNSHPEVIRHTGELACPSVAAARARIAAYPDFERYGFGITAAERFARTRRALHQQSATGAARDAPSTGKASV